MIRVVVDTNVVVSAALVRHGNPAAILNLVFSRDIVPCVSNAVLAEYEEVLSRPRIRVDQDRSKEIRDAIYQVAIVVEPQVSLRVCSDRDDDMFMECAVESQADFLITGNIRDFPERYQSVVVTTPKEFMEMWKRLHV